jgi:AcrR family transcriptional regulator
MSSDDAAAEASGDSSSGGRATSWRELAVTRSLDPARVRAEKRVQRFLDAALELMSSSENKDFTVQQVVERSGQSLRSFYQYFAGKYELMLALFEESVRTTAAHLEEKIAPLDDPLERLRLFLSEYYALCTPPPPGRRSKRTPNPLAIAEFAQQLLTAHPKEAAQAFRPLVSILEGLLDDAATQGVVRDGLDHQRVAGVILQAIMFNTFASTISGSPVRDHGDEVLWDLAINGLAR